MRYLGALRGAGMLFGKVEPLGRVDYEFDGYMVRPGEVVASGEVRMEAELLNSVFARQDLSLHTDDGRTLLLRFSGKRHKPTSDYAHVDVHGGLPDAKAWRR